MKLKSFVVLFMSYISSLYMTQLRMLCFLKVLNEHELFLWLFFQVSQYVWIVLFQVTPNCEIKFKSFIPNTIILGSLWFRSERKLPLYHFFVMMHWKQKWINFSINFWIYFSQIGKERTIKIRKKCEKRKWRVRVEEVTGVWKENLEAQIDFIYEQFVLKFISKSCVWIGLKPWTKRFHKKKRKPKFLKNFQNVFQEEMNDI